MEWDITADQINDGELTFSLTEFTNKMFKMVSAEVKESETAPAGAENQTEPLENYFVQYYVCFYNYMLCLATDRSRWGFVSHTKRLMIDQDIKKRFMDKKYLILLAEEQKETVDIFKAVLKRFVSDLIEAGVSTNRLPQMIYMQQLNSFSSILPSIMKNEKARKMLVRIEFHNSFFGSLKSLFKLPIGG
ncbi:hypothetical protein [Seleniivibrio woodruffii]|uniref:hypothetical protein n=1 Tax=Seleniivibrio woodruffii TaxID=1078050 RepID=UPI0026EB65F3|nr:hypothetical protein [Seleniivibrio woodruffii]